ncbi:hypothetical protein BJY27_000821 [Streptomyces rapamycinicus]|uniref:Uncharacterized protein n=1 Tax=Streptomyces rapamycinicus TaxID=1226757 RepID=A0ABR6LBZ7_9ACTN|nr:hypothetical protein [Streptomyces rapamycinicus]MBB4779860.1 hypothetical protein [Streptomyces rapamycinicus]
MAPTPSPGPPQPISQPSSTSERVFAEFANSPSSSMVTGPPKRSVPVSTRTVGAGAPEIRTVTASVASASPYDGR